MGLFNIRTKSRKNGVQPPEIKDLAQGILFTATGLLLASLFTYSLASILKYILIALGIILCTFGVIKQIKYIKQAIAFKKHEPKWDLDRGLFDEFAIELNKWYDKGDIPQSCDGDTAYFLRLQKERLDNKDIKMRMTTQPVKGDSYGTATYPRKSLWYTTDMTYENTLRHLEFSNSSDIIYDRDVEETMYEIITHSPNETELLHITTTCPNCGAVSLVTQLTEGCSYCSTKFKITDLFPRVTNLYFIKSNSINSNKSIMRNTILISMLLGAIVGLICYFSLATGDLPYLLFIVYSASFLSIIPGFILGEILMLISSFHNDGRKHIPLFKTMSSKSKIKSTMCRLDKYFSYDKFESQIISLVRMAVFSEHPENLASYRANGRDKRFDDIVDMTYISALMVKKLDINGPIIRMTLRTWWINYSEIAGEIKKTGDCIDVSLSRNISSPEPPGFSITSVSCHNCGRSFDAVRQHICPYCGSEYHMENQGWIIEDMKLIR